MYTDYTYIYADGCIILAGMWESVLLLTSLAGVLKKVRDADAGDYAAQIAKITKFTAGKGNCSLIEMAAAPIVSALALFPEDFAHHAKNGTCGPGLQPS